MVDGNEDVGALSRVVTRRGGDRISLRFSRLGQLRRPGDVALTPARQLDDTGGALWLATLGPDGIRGVLVGPTSIFLETEPAPLDHEEPVVIGAWQAALFCAIRHGGARNASARSGFCEVLEGFHAWRSRPASIREIQDAKLVTAIETSFRASDRTYGARRVWRDVLEDRLDCRLHRIERLMRQNAMRARPKRRGKPKDDGARSIIADNVLDRNFEADRPLDGSEPIKRQRTTSRTALPRGIRSWTRAAP